MSSTPSTLPTDKAGLARYVDHTLLKPEATAADVAALVAEGAELGVFSVCVSPTFVARSVAEAAGGLAVATVYGFPSGKHHSEIKAAEAARSVADGADEVDMVIDVGAAIAGDFATVESDIVTVRAAVPDGKILKVIIESSALDDDQIVAACRASEAAGADFVKTSTGFHPAGGASTHAVELMSRIVAPGLGVKASGGVRTMDQAQAMIAAGATRLGVSGSRALLSGAQPGSGY